MSNRRKLPPAAQAAQAIGRMKAGNATTEDYVLLDKVMEGDTALLVHCLHPNGPVTIVIPVKNWAHAAACIESPAIADDLSGMRKVFEIVPMRESAITPNPFHGITGDGIRNGDS